MTATERAALIRGVYNALGTFAVTFLTTYLMNDVLRDAIIIAAISSLGVLGFRAGAEGIYDNARNVAGQVQPGDVTANPGGPVV